MPTKILAASFSILLFGCSAPPSTNGKTVYTVSAFCGEPCPWSQYKLHSDSQVFSSVDAALAEARSWSAQFGVTNEAVDIMLSYWNPGQDLDAEFPLDDGRKLDLLLYTDTVK